MDNYLSRIATRLEQKERYSIGSSYYCGGFAVGKFRWADYYFYLYACFLLTGLAVLMGAMIPFCLVHNAPAYAVLMQIGLIYSASYLATEKPIQIALDLFLRTKKVSKDIRKTAKLWYGTEWREAAIECHEAHYPGDCPLCGAE